MPDINFHFPMNSPAEDALAGRVVLVELWYDRHTRSWVVERRNLYGHQIGEADYVSTREQALPIRAQYVKQYGVANVTYFDAAGHRHPRKRRIRGAHLSCPDCLGVVEVHEAGKLPDGFIKNPREVVRIAGERAMRGD